MILDGKKLSKNILNNISLEIKTLKNKPCLAVILVGDDYASSVYVNKKIKTCNEVDIKSIDYKLDKNYKEEDLLKLIDELNSNDEVNGILVQLPLPAHIDTKKIIKKISAKKDVDGFSPTNLGLLLSNDTPYFYPATPLGIMMLLEHYNIEVKAKNICIINDSIIVGRPLAAMLLNKGASVSICHKLTKNLKDYTLNADIIISATGVLHLLDDSFFNENAVAIDVGICKKENNKLISGDINYEKVANKIKAISPVPGGVGPMTIAALMFNTLKSYKEKNND